MAGESQLGPDLCLSACVCLCVCVCGPITHNFGSVCDCNRCSGQTLIEHCHSVDLAGTAKVQVAH